MTELDRLAQSSRWRTRPLAEKALLALGLLALAVILPPWPGAALVLAVAAVGTLLAGVPFGPWLRAAAPALVFVLVGAATVLVSLDGSLDGPSAAVAALRGTAAMVSLLLLASTTPVPDLLRGARRLGLPAEIAEVALTTWRFVFLLGDTARAIHASQSARLGGRHPLRSLGLLIAALLPRALDRARRLEIGLQARGYDGALPTLAPERAATPSGLAAVAGTLALVTGAALWLG